MTQYSSAAVGVAFALLGVACTKTYIVQPATGGATATANESGLTLTAVPNAWSGEPSDLNEYLTPIWIRLENDQAEDVRVVYTDIVLTDESGFRYAAISPYTGQPSYAAEPASTQPNKTQSGHFDTGPVPTPSPTDTAPPASVSPQVEPDTQPDNTSGWGEQTRRQEAPSDSTTALRFDNAEDIAVHAELVRHGGGGGGFRGGGFRGGGFGGGHFVGHGYWGPHWGVGVYPYYLGYYPYYAPWPYFYYWPPYYGPYSYYWDDRYYPAAPSDDVLHYGLPQGALKAGGKVAGYVYFQNAATRATRLDLTWTAHTVDGKSIGSVRVPLVVIRD